MASCSKCQCDDNPIVEGPDWSGENEIQVHRKCEKCGHVQIEYYHLDLIEIDDMEGQDEP